LKVNDDRKTSFVLENKLNIKDYQIWEKGVIRVYEKLDKISEVNKVMVSNDIEVKEIAIKLDSLEDYFLKLVGKNQIRTFHISDERGSYS